MDRSKRIFHLRREGQAFAECITLGPLDARVPSCTGWTLDDLARHLGRVHGWAGAATTANERPARPVLDWPADAPGLSDSFLAGLALLIDALDGPADAPAWSFAPGHGTLGFWQRRQLIETAIHRWDADAALGRAGTLNSDVAADGLDELADILVGLRIAEGKLAPSASVVFEASDGARWQLGQGPVVAEVHGAASDLLLLGWGRLDADADVLAWSGDEASGRAIVRAGLTP